MNYTLFQVLKTHGHWADKVKVEQEPDNLHALLMSSAYSQTANSYLTLILSVQGGFRPRAIMMEYNSNFELDEAKSILPPDDGELCLWVFL